MYARQIARQVVTRSLWTEFPERQNCDCCDNLLVGRTDQMRTVRVVRTIKGSKRASSTLMCEPCAVARDLTPKN